MNPREFTTKWIAGMKNLSPELQLKAQISGCYGNLVGFAGGIVTMLYLMFGLNQWQWWWSVVILIVVFWTTIIDLIKKKQQLRSLTELEEQLKSIEHIENISNINEISLKQHGGVKV